MSDVFDLEGFNANEVEIDEGGGDYAPIPNDEYAVEISNSETKIAKSGDEYLALTLSIIEGDLANRLIFMNLNLKSSSPEAKKISKSQLAQICLAVSTPTPSSILDLHDKAFVVKTKIKKSTYQGKDYDNVNVVNIKKYNDDFTKPVASDDAPF